ncbi:hypothetical protein FEO86_02890 [Stenotrophomonas maltophilia]|nr:hypothetical protein FEO86_02890 [Stenotrophomonas maltophilia]
MPRTLPQPDPPRLRQFPASCRNGSWGQIRFPQENGSDPGFNSRSDRFHPRMAWIYHRHQEPVGGGAVWVGRTVGAMDGAIEPPGVRALCLRSTASQAPERTAASGWAGPRKGGVRRVLPAHTAPPNQ